MNEKKFSMIKFWLALFVMFVCVTRGECSLLISESFNYSPGTILDSTVQCTGTGLDSYWKDLGFVIAEVKSGSLTAPSNYGYTPNDNSIGTPDGQAWSGAVIEPNPSNKAFLGSNSFYFSFLYHKGDDDFLGLAFSMPSAAVVYYLQLSDSFSGTSSTRFSLTLQGSEDNYETGLIEMDVGKDYLIVGKATNNVVGTDIFEFTFYDSASDAIPIAEPDTFIGRVDGIDVGTPVIGTLYIEPYNGAVFDELLVGTEWSDVTVVPEPATFVLFGLGIMMLRKRRNR